MHLALAIVMHHCSDTLLQRVGTWRRKEGILDVSSSSISLTLYESIKSLPAIYSIWTFEVCKVQTHRRLFSSAGRSNFISFLYLFTCASRTKLIFITWFMYLKFWKTDSTFVYKKKKVLTEVRVISRCTYLSMVPNNHLGSLLKGITISWKRANLMAISAEMAGSETCSVRKRVFWGKRDTQKWLIQTSTLGSRSSKYSRAFNSPQRCWCYIRN